MISINCTGEFKQTKKSSKGNGRRKCSKVDEDDCCKDLRVQSICVVADVVAVTSLNVFNHPTKRIAGTGQRVFPGRLWWFVNWKTRRRRSQGLLLMLMFGLLFCCLPPFSLFFLCPGRQLNTESGSAREFNFFFSPKALPECSLSV